MPCLEIYKACLIFYRLRQLDAIVEFSNGCFSALSQTLQNFSTVHSQIFKIEENTIDLVFFSVDHVNYMLLPISENGCIPATESKLTKPKALCFFRLS